MVAERGLKFYDKVNGVEADGSKVRKRQPQLLQEWHSAPVDSHPLHAILMLLAEYSVHLRHVSRR